MRMSCLPGGTSSVARGCEGRIVFNYTDDFARTSTVRGFGFLRSEGPREITCDYSGDPLSQKEAEFQKKLKNYCILRRSERRSSPFSCAFKARRPLPAKGGGDLNLTPH
jgi:hypothetical protein